MKILMFYHSLISDWNHGNAHFLRGICSELMSRGHSVQIFEPYNSWSYDNLIENYGIEIANEFFNFYPDLTSVRYREDELNLESLLSSVDLVIVHEWNDHSIVKKIGTIRKSNSNFRLLFHDTHHRSLSDPETMSRYDLSNYDGVLAYGKVIKDIYLNNGWIEKAWVWHEAADIRIFHPKNKSEKSGDLVWIGNWGDDERTIEIKEYFINPSRTLNIKTAAYGVRYPDHALVELKSSGIEYKGWLPNYLVPEVFSNYKVTIHIPRRPYSELLTGIPTIRPFEALACGIPLICSPWKDTENLFTPGEDFLIANDEKEMTDYLFEILTNYQLAKTLAEHGLKTILNKHTCGHRVNELMDICRSLKVNTEPELIKKY